MANYIRTTDNTYPHSESSIRAEFNQTSFPTPFRPPEGYEVVFQSPTPAYDPITQYVREITPALINGKYYQAFEVVDYPAEQAAANQAAANRQSILSQITTLEASITQRRTREAILGTDNGWLANVDSQIAALRAQL